MLNAMYPIIKWEQIQSVGFDLDGTLYDEFDFILKVYKKIVEKLITKTNQKMILDYMIKKWLEKGSRYPFIFKETQEKNKLRDNFETKSLTIFRNYHPKLIISERIKFFLENLNKSGKYLFILSNGREKLQNKKIDSLNIRKYFNLIIIAEKNQKPDAFYGNIIAERNKLEPNKVIYIGDHITDRKFAKNCGFIFFKSTILK